MMKCVEQYVWQVGKIQMVTAHVELNEDIPEAWTEHHVCQRTTTTQPKELVWDS